MNRTLENLEAAASLRGAGKVCRPGRHPDTGSASEAGETWRYLFDPVGATGELSDHTAAYLYRKSTPGGGWGADLCRTGGPNARLIVHGGSEAPDAPSLEWIVSEVERLLVADGLEIVADPSRAGSVLEAE